MFLPCCTGAFAAAQNRSFNSAAPLIYNVTDLHSDKLSPAAVQLAHSLLIADQLKRLTQLRKGSANSTGALSTETRLDINELKVSLIETIERARLDIDFAVAEIEGEQALLEELVQAYSTDTINRANKENLWSFRTNGILWAAAESLSIPTFSHPRYSIASGTLGIVAGLVPSLFSAYAVHTSGGKHYERQPYPNMLTQIYDCPTTPNTEFPKFVFEYFNSIPPGQSRTRREILIDHWRSDKNIHIFDRGLTATKVSLLTGSSQNDVTIDLLNDRLTMLREVKALTLHINRPLLELMMAVQGQKNSDQL
jgi:hypothetical protein